MFNQLNKPTMKTLTKTQFRPISEIAIEIKQDWAAKINYGAKPYLSCMMTLNSITDNYGMDSAKSIIAYFLANASNWRGDTAKRIKLELNKMIK
jgi:hypothetical protein